MIEERLAALASETSWADLPPRVRDHATALTVDALANAVAGRSAETVAGFEAAAGQNAYQMTVYTMCDVYRPALCHVTPEVVPAALAAAELAGASGADFLLATALGLEVTVRVCRALDYPAFRARGWHSPGVAGALGAAAAAGRLLGLGTDAMTGCLGLAGAQAAGTFAAIGTVAVKFHQANGARAGLAAAVYAAGGFAGSRRILTAPDGGILGTYSGGGEPGLAVAGLGESWELSRISMRSYPAASTLQALVDCLLSDAARQAGPQAAVTVWLPPHAYLLGAGGWHSQLSAMQSARFVTAAVVRDGSCWLDTFSPARRADPRLIAFADRCTDVRSDEKIEEGGVRVLLSGSGGTLELRRDYPRGDSREPLTSTEVRAKAARSLAAGLPEGRCEAALAALAELAAARRITDLTGALAGEGR